MPGRRRLGDCRGAHAAALLPALERLVLGAAVAPQARHQVVEVDQVAVEVGAVDAGELHLVADLDAAAAAHAGAVDHHRVQADDGADAVRPRRLGAALHHHRRADRDHLVDVGMARDRLLEAGGDAALQAGASRRRCRRSARRTRRRTCPARTSGRGCGSRSRRSPWRPARGTRGPAGTPAPRPARRRRRPPSSACRCGWECPSARPARTASVPTWQSRRISCVVLPTAWITRVMVPALAVEVGQRQRDALAVLVGHHDDELAGLGGARHHRMLDFEQEGDVGKILAGDDVVAAGPGRGIHGGCGVG